MKTVCYCFLIVLAGVLTLIALFEPSILNSNLFLVGFINHEILNIQAVIVTVSLVSISQTHLEFSRVERRLGGSIFNAARREINSTATVMIGSLFAILLLLLFSGGTNPQTSPNTTAFFKAGCLILLAVGILAMADIIRIAYELATAEKIEGPDGGEDKGE